MKPFNTLTNSMRSSGIRKIMALSEDVDGCIHLEVGQPDFRTPEHILEAAAHAAHDGFTKYTNSAGIPELRQAIAQKVIKKNGYNVGPQNVVVSPGAVCSMFTTLLSLVDPGEEVLLPDPGWPNYTMQMSCIGANPVYYPLDQTRGFQIDFDILEKLITQKTKVLVLNTPGNPTGAVITREAIEKSVELARKYDLFLISDEIYEDIIFEGTHSSAGLYNDDGRIITIYGFSKSYAAMGLRVGYTVCEEKIAKLLTKLQEPVVSCASSISQKACVAALTGSQDSVAEMTAAYKKRRDAVVDILRKHGLYQYTPSGAFYILIDISRTGRNSTDFAVELLNKKKVAVAPGETFGQTTKNYIRVSFAIEIEKLKEGMNILCEKINA
ncbi:MAG: pyridoxal phosphate-dependent aminotransferase [Candidatus Latescibacteria bacterium]|nr:pyridoxal phosphate-dependent aminotransferase [Candidatus Latescibacterota bacterium]